MIGEGSMEYWVLIENGSEAEWGLMHHCAALTAGTEIIPAALIREGLDAAKAFTRGAQKVFVLQGTADPGQTGGQVARLAGEARPAAILCTADRRGRMIAAVAAALLETGLAADCTEIRRREDGLLVMTRPTFGGSLLADIICPEHRPQIATVRPGSYLADTPSGGKTCGPVIQVEPSREPPDTVLLQSVVTQAQPLPTAKKIVAGGKGVGSREGFQLLERLAAAMGAAVGASRAAVNAGYAPYHQQIGLTGQTVRPEVYLAFGISGAAQHLVGMEKSGTVIAVNSDPRAPIFEYADYGLVQDWRETAEALLQLYSQQ